MKQLALLLASFLTLSSAPALANEGMWMPEQVPQHAQTLLDLGYQGDPLDLANPLGGVLSAVVSVGGFCSGSFISSQGLIATNHHCAVGGVQFHQASNKTEQDLISDGFYASSLEGEVWAGPSYSVYITESLTDVTKDIARMGKRRIGDARRAELIEARIKEQVAQCEAGPAAHCRVASYDGGARYVLVRQKEIKDLRLVYVPPEMVGNYGDDIDNWQWPRHSGDFSLLRAYVAPDGSSAEYSPDNVPYSSEHWFPMAHESVKDGDLVLVAGYPGSTQRHRSLKELKWDRDLALPRRIERYQEIVDRLHQAVEDRPEAASKLHGRIQGYENALKLYRGILEGLRDSPAVAIKEAEDQALRAQKGSALEALDGLVDRSHEHDLRDFEWYGVRRGSVLFGAALRLARFAHQAARPDSKRDLGYQDRDREDWAPGLANLLAWVDPPTDSAFLGQGLARVLALTDDPLPALSQALGDDTAGAIALITQAILDGTSSLQDDELRSSLLEKSEAELLALHDPLLDLAIALQPWLDQEHQRGLELKGASARIRPGYLQALQTTLGDAYYPDANGTLRLTWGRVGGYSPKDSVHYDATSSLAGIVEKHRDELPFDAPDALLRAIEQSEGQAQPKVNFASDVDTTGGNSGSATLNARGEFCGFLFDGTYESLRSEYVFDTRLNRSIHADAQYLLWTLKRVVHDTRILRELGVEELW